MFFGNFSEKSIKMTKKYIFHCPYSPPPNNPVEPSKYPTLRQKSFWEGNYATTSHFRSSRMNPPPDPLYKPTVHSGLGGGGLGHFGVNFFYCFFGVLWPSYMHMGWGKCNLPSGKASKGSKSKPILGLDHRFPLYFAILHKVSSVL